MRLICLTTLFLCLSITAFTQSNINWGLTLEGSVGVLTNSDETAKAYYGSSSLIYPDDRIESRGIWNTNELSIECIFRQRFKLSLGLRMLNWYASQDSTLTSFDYSSSNFGKADYYNSFIVPKISVAYYHQVKEKWNLFGELSFGFPEIASRHGTKTKAYDQNGQIYFDWEDSKHPRLDYSFGANNYLFDGKGTLGMQYALSRFNLHSGVSYYFFNDKRSTYIGDINGEAQFNETKIQHRGVYLNLGVSYWFKSESN